jgi:two-component system response regulator FixJ
MTEKAKVYVIDDDSGVRDSIVFLLKTEDISAIGFESAESFLRSFDPKVPCCLVVDVKMPGMSGLELQAELNKRQIQVPVIIITGHADIGMAVEAMKMGASDFVEKPFDDQVLIDKVKEMVVSQQATRQEEARRSETLSLIKTLTPREREVMALLAKGKLNKVIAGELNISARTVEAHRAKVMEKLKARSLADIVKAELMLE